MLDFACGLGLSGVVASRFADLVEFVDISPDALLFTRLNSMLNTPATTALSHCRQRFRCFDWQRDHWETRYDHILAADVLYDREHWEHVVRFWNAHLAADGTVWLAEPGRAICRELESWLASCGWQVALCEPSMNAPISGATAMRCWHVRRTS